MLTVELPPLISFRVSKADVVSLMKMFSMFWISESSFGTWSSVSFVSFAAVEPHATSSKTSLVDKDWPRCPLLGKIMLSITSHSFTSLLSTSILKNGWFKTSWIKGNRSSAPVRLSYFFIILTKPAQRMRKENTIILDIHYHKNQPNQRNHFSLICPTHPSIPIR